LIKIHYISERFIKNSNMCIIYAFMTLQIIGQLGRRRGGNISHEISMDALWYICTYILY